MWEERYQGKDYLFGREPAAFLLSRAALLPKAGRVLAVADGEGRNSVWLARQGLDVTAFDYAPSAVEKARSLAGEAGVSVNFKVAGIENWDWGAAPFDVVAGIFIQFVRPEARPALFANLRRAVRPGGKLFLHGYSPEQVELGTGGPPRADMMYSIALLQEAFGDWEIELLEAYEREIEEGHGHKGRSALIDLVAVKPLAS